MDIVYTFLTRRTQTVVEGAEVGEAVDVLWAHAGPADHLEHAGGRAEPGRLDLLLFFLPPDGTDPADSAEQRAAGLLHRAHQASPLLQDRYLSPPEPGTPHVDAPHAAL